MKDLRVESDGDWGGPGGARLSLVLAFLGACSVPRPPAVRTPLACAAPCAEIREILGPATVVVDIHTSPGSWLENALVTSAGEAGCKSGIPVRSVEVDGVPYPEGPASLAGMQNLKLHFPFVSEYGSEEFEEIAPSPPVSLDLDFRSANRETCLRMVVPKASSGPGYVTGELSFRLDTRR